MPITIAEPISGVPDMCYRVLIRTIDHKPSKSGAPMTTLGVQILSPDKVTLPDGRTADTAGIEGKIYISFSDRALGFAKRGLRKLGVPVEQIEATVNSVPEYITAVQRHLDGLQSMTFEMRVTTEAAQPLKGADGQPMTDSAGHPILGNPQTRFDHGNIVGNLVPLSALGVSAPAF